ncbi:MAG: hypothetical protein JXB17_02495 [Bacteroidales bacterium]|nr:hypothetical protein [Bacteroidales bacterium]
MKTFLLLLFVINCWTSIYCSQKKGVVISEGTATVDFPENKSLADVKKEAEQKAKINALEKAFGTVIFQGNSTYISNINTGEKIETRSDFTMIGKSYVKGEVIEVLNIEFEEKPGYKIINNQKKEYKELECKIKIKARELTNPKIDIIAKPLSNPDKFAVNNSFKYGDTLFIYFQSPSDGYLTIFLDDNNYSYCLFPYKGMPNEYNLGIPVEGEKEYILFSEKYDKQYFSDIDITTPTYLLTTNESSEMDLIIIIFSKTPLNKPTFKDGISKELLTEIQREMGCSLPDMMKSEEFQHWLIKNRIARTDMQVDYINITISKNIN